VASYPRAATTIVRYLDRAQEDADMGVTDSTASPDGIGKRMRSLPKPSLPSIRTEQVRQWFGQLVGSRKGAPLAALERGLKRQLEMLRDEIAQARSAGLSWSAIGAMVGLHPDVVRSILADEAT
jgi:hypothetical protein